MCDVVSGNIEGAKSDRLQFCNIAVIQKLQLDKKLGDQKILTDFGGFL